MTYPGQAFVVRALSPKSLLGGGTVDAGVSAENGDDAVAPDVDAIAHALAETDLSPRTAAELGARANVRAERAAEILTELVAQGVARELRRPLAFIDGPAADALSARIRETLARRETDAPWTLGTTSLALARELVIDEQFLVRFLAAEAEDGTIAARAGYYSTLDHKAQLTAEQRAFFERVVPVDPAQPLVPASLEDVVAELRRTRVAGLAQALDTLVATGALVKVGGDVYRGPQIDEIRKRLELAIRRDGPITMARFRDAVGTTRKYAVPLMEWFDATGRSPDRYWGLEGAAVMSPPPLRRAGVMPFTGSTCAPTATRTRDLPLRRRSLYPLSYRGLPKPHVTWDGARLPLLSIRSPRRTGFGAQRPGKWRAKLSAACRFAGYARRRGRIFVASIAFTHSSHADRRSCGLVSVEETVPPHDQEQQEAAVGGAREKPEETPRSVPSGQPGEKPGATTSEGKPKGRGSRPDIQGLRALAVGMVVIYHLYPSLLTGGFAGVDVFFVISGFLITGHLLRQYHKPGQVALLDFWGRRAKRLVPAAAANLLSTALSLFRSVSSQERLWLERKSPLHQLILLLRLHDR